MMLSQLVEDYAPLDLFRIRFDRFKLNQQNSFERSQQRRNICQIKLPKVAFGTNPERQTKIKYESPRRFYDRNYSQIDKKLRIPSMRQEENKQSKSLNMRQRVNLSQHGNFFLQTQNFTQSRINPNLNISHGRNQRETDSKKSLKLNLLPMTQKELNESLITLLNKYHVATQVSLNYDDP